MKSVGVLKITRRTLTGEELPVIIINPKGIHKYDIVENEELILEVSDKEGRPLEEVVIVKRGCKMEVRFERPSYSLLREIRELDHQCYNNINIPYKWYKYRYIDLEGILIARIDNRIIGYCSIIGIDRQILNLMKDGMFIDDYSISHKAYKKLYEVDTFYLSSIVVLPEERNKGIGENLLKEAIDNISNYTKEYEIVALAISDSGLKVTEKVGFKRLRCVEDVSIMFFSSKINRILKDRGVN